MTENQIRYLEAQEAKRANLVREIETNRSNLAKEKETKRANLENERMAREKWDYEKYGSGKGVGGIVRSIKAGINDVYKVATLATDNMFTQQGRQDVETAIGKMSDDQLSEGITKIRNRIKEMGSDPNVASDAYEAYKKKYEEQIQMIKNEQMRRRAAKSAGVTDINKLPSSEKQKLIDNQRKDDAQKKILENQRKSGGYGGAPSSVIRYIK